MSEEKSKKALNFLWKLSLIFVILGGIGGFIGGIFFVEDRIEKRISEKLKDPELISQIASLVRPSLIFNHKGTILSDSGGEQFIENISVQMGPEEPTEIIISPKTHLNSAPILECINYNFDITSKRIKKSDWLFELSSPSYLVFEKSSEKKEYLFRLEIIK
ncbi:MAG: hypothetical protein JRF60_03760 [Deltaproteobacteria bacterium]|nr:hypothetical protein [Deltaproteobacteria bacterium]